MMNHPETLNQDPVSQVTEVQDLEQEEQKKPSAVGQALNKVFHFYDRGSTMKQEIKAGLSVFLISICALFMNISVMTAAFESDQPYLGMYLGAVIVSFIGSLLIGILANLPLVQCASLSLSAVMVSMLSVNEGLTYTNMLAVTFVSAIVYAVLMLLPKVKDLVYGSLPHSVRKALPAALGVYIAKLALEQIGFFEALESTDAVMREAYVNFCILFGLIGIVIVAVLKFNGSKNPYLTGFLWTTLLFFTVSSLTGSSGVIFSANFSLNRIYIGLNTDSNGELYLIGSALAQVKFGEVFASGFDFSAYTDAGGNVLKLFVQGILIFLFMGMYESEGSMDAAAMEQGQSYTEQDKKKLLLINAVTNVVAPVCYVAPVSLAKESSISVRDGGQTGLTSIVCSIGYFASMFTWALFCLLATECPVVPEYGHAGFLFPAVVTASFQIASAVMFVVGISMLKSFRSCDFANPAEAVSFPMTVAVTLAAENIVYGVAFGVLSYVLVNVLSLRKERIQQVKPDSVVLFVLMVVLMILAFC